ncbi:hypothetical protein A5698_02745 [Mycobacterium sp. E136]|uniref:YkgB family protein n=1 Tax=Mycobacterium sp. E136 TaxID=1834125 RepID=UPI0007FC00C1|nr:DUF417 family protein [Mycobacterium sp. E136]OBG86514.1 hypothetical protein A5698_02745 [Mycobacterium sp. E136]
MREERRPYRTPETGSRSTRSTAVNTAAGLVLRYGLVLVIGWIGLMKFTSYEAYGIEPLVANSPFMGWLYGIFSVTTFSALGSVVAVVLFVATISFLFTTPGIGEEAAGGFPMLSTTGQFLIKDVVLLGASLWTLADSVRAARHRGVTLAAR